MKYYLVVSDPINEGLTGANTRLCVEQHIEMNVNALAQDFPGKPIVVMKPIATYNAKIDIKLTKFNINDKMEVIPA